MIGTFTAEWRKLTRRPAVWWLAGLVVSMLLVFYAFSWIQYTSSTFQPDRGLTVAQLKAGLYPANFTRQIVEGLAVLGGALVLVMGALVVGSEFGWTTWKMVYTQGPGRWQALAGQVAGVSVINAVLVAVIFAVGAGSSFAIATIDGHAAVWPALLDIVKAAGATFLIFECWALFGMALSYLFRQSAMAIGLGLAYMLAVEGILFRALNAFHIGWITTAEKFFVGQNINALAASFGQTVQRPGPAAASLVSADQALLVIALYALAFVAMAAALVRVRDVT